LRSATDGIRDSVHDLNQDVELIADEGVTETAKACVDVATELAELLPDAKEQ
jgi:hypothetical protein